MAGATQLHWVLLFNPPKTLAGKMIHIKQPYFWHPNNVRSFTFL